MSNIKLKWRSFFNGKEFPPTPIKLQIPGWAGGEKVCENGSKPQPWHCLPFVEGSTYGIELKYPFDTECVVKNINGETIFEGDFTEESKKYNHSMPPFETFAKGYFGFTSSFDLQPPPDHIIRIEPHPKYYTDFSYTTPLPVVGHIQGEWWTKIFFIVFKQPPLNGKYIFRKGEPYAQILILPKKINYDIEEMSEVEKNERILLESNILKYNKHFCKKWQDDKGNFFDNKYKFLSSVFAKEGLNGINKIIKNYDKKKTKIKLFKFKKNEINKSKKR
jgi:hypothetical protein